MAKPDPVFLQMWGPTREHLIANHEFYVAEARRRLLEPFDDDRMKADAKRHAAEWLAERVKNFDPNRDDPADAYEQAYDESICFFHGLTALRDSTRLSVISSMFHDWEKQLRDWLGKELGQNGFGKHAHAAVWSVPLDSLLDLLESCKWPIKSLGFYDELQRCQLVTNVFKHGTGRSFRLLKKRAPDLVEKSEEIPAFWVSALDYSSLSVSEDHLARFAKAITAFWQQLPENIYFSQVGQIPKWLDKALKRERGWKV
ncbi:hypothetical protein BPTFM16_01828 [Altererythrobacter insulae]|nr:hypothetical protein BPTFM16_01828 [Altererythrobacter insulae]